MSQLTLHNLDEALHDGLRDLAASHGRTIEEEAREILRGAVLAVHPSAANNGAAKLGSRIAARFSNEGIERDIPETRGQPAVPPDLSR
jgi:plasmid stability protein